MRNFMMSNFWTQPFNPVLPTVDDDTLSYYEFVKKIFYHYNDLQREIKKQFDWVNNQFDQDAKEIFELAQRIDDLNQKWITHHDTLLQLANKYTDSQISSIKNYTDIQLSVLDRNINSVMTTLQKADRDNFASLMQRISDNTAMLNNNIKIVDSKLKPLKQELQTYTNKAFHIANVLLHDYIELNDTEIAKINTDINLLETKLNTIKTQNLELYYNLDKKLTGQIANALEDLKNQVADINGNAILVTDPTSGKRNNLKDTLANIYSVPWWAKITTKEYDSMLLTTKNYDERKIRTIDYDSHARFIFFDELYLKKWWDALLDYNDSFNKQIDDINKRLIMRNPISGKYTTIPITIYDIVNKLHNEYKLTTKAYDDLMLKAGAYDGASLTIFEYDFYAKNFLMHI